tara:strand:- start:4313 stop:5050 length:738 start_codon:yes stop_codon:yes gene_type:complete
MTDTVETMEENIETPVRPVKPVQEQIDPKEWARKAASAYRYDTLVDNTHIPQMNRPKVIPVKETFESNSEYINNIDGSFGVRATKDIESGGLVEECHYWVMETRLNDFIKGTKDKVGVRLLWTTPCDDTTYECEKYGPHMIIPRGNAMSYQTSETPNAYWEMDAVTRTIRFFALRPITNEEHVTIAPPSMEAVGPSGITPQEFQDISGLVAHVPSGDSNRPGGCSSCGKKAAERKQFRDRSKETS